MGTPCSMRSVADIARNEWQEVDAQAVFVAPAKEVDGRSDLVVARPGVGEFFCQEPPSLLGDRFRAEDFPNAGDPQIRISNLESRWPRQRRRRLNKFKLPNDQMFNNGVPVLVISMLSF